MIIDFITAHDPTNIKTWSGINYFLLQTLRDQGHQVNIITNLKAKPNFGLKWRYHWYKFWGKNYQYERSYCYTKQFGVQAMRSLSTNADIVLTTSPAVLPYLKSVKPIVLFTDATFNNLAEYYQHFSKLPKASYNMGNALEGMGLRNATYCYFSSAWAAQSAIDFYNIPANKVSVVGFGANLHHIPSTAFIQQRIQHKSTATLNFLWSGIGYLRKGGDFALKVVAWLRENGIEARLNLVGVNTAETGQLPEFVTVHGFLDKGKAEDMVILNSLYTEAHFFILPTQLDCSPVVLSEAAAYGLPALATNISGIPSVVEQDKSGWLFHTSDEPQQWGKQVKYILDNNKYALYAQQARAVYDARLNWPNTVLSILNKIGN